VSNIEVNGRVAGACVELQLPAAIAASNNPPAAAAQVRAASPQPNPVTVRKTRGKRRSAQPVRDSAVSRVMEDAR
jgi:hypothetical protein